MCQLDLIYNKCLGLEDHEMYWEKQYNKSYIIP
jgi:hypothetical protein